ncbi:hypothetical protein [Escherichia coli]
MSNIWGAVHDAPYPAFYDYFATTRILDDASSSATVAQKPAR